MKQLVVISGKGGTGKSTLTASFAALAKDAVLVDADVDAADLHLLFKPEILENGEYSGGKKAEIDPDLCIHCDECVTHCRFHAINADHVVDWIACEGCGVCSRVCPVEAAQMKPALSGHYFDSKTRFGAFFHAKLGIAAENSGKLVSTIRKRASDYAEAEGKELIIIDGSPGVGCPVIASVTGCDFALAVTEPSLSGMSDLKRIAELILHFKIPMGVVINKADLNPDMASEIERYCEESGIRLLGRIPFDEAVVKSIAACEVLVDYSRGAASEAVKAVWERAKLSLEEATGGE